MRIKLIAVQTQRLVDSAALYQALGGGLSGDHAAIAAFYPVKTNYIAAEVGYFRNNEEILKLAPACSSEQYILPSSVGRSVTFNSIWKPRGNFSGKLL